MTGDGPPGPVTVPRLSARARQFIDDAESAGVYYDVRIISRNGRIRGADLQTIW